MKTSSASIMEYSNFTIPNYINQTCYNYKNNLKKEQPIFNQMLKNQNKLRRKSSRILTSLIIVLKNKLTQI